MSIIEKYIEDLAKKTNTDLSDDIQASELGRLLGANLDIEGRFLRYIETAEEEIERLSNSLEKQEKNKGRAEMMLICLTTSNLLSGINRDRIRFALKKSGLRIIQKKDDLSISYSQDA